MGLVVFRGSLRQGNFALLTGLAQRFLQLLPASFCEEIFIGPKLDAHQPPKFLRSVACQEKMWRAFHDQARERYRILDALHARYSPGLERGPIHDGSIHLMG